MRIKVSKDSYKIKPGADDIKKISWQMKNNDCIEVDYIKLKKLIAAGHSVLLADFNKIGSIKEDNINSLSCLALDIDSKENPIQLKDMIELVKNKFGITPKLYYCTFSDENEFKFRLIYRLHEPVDVETYKILYKAIVWKLGKYIDNQTVNPNRIWAGTDKKVILVEDDKPITFEIMVRLVKSYSNKLKREEKKKTISSNIKYDNSNYADYISTNDRYIKPEYKKEVLDLLINSIDLREFIPKHLGGNFKKYKDDLQGCCVLPNHSGDRNNKTALLINYDRYKCFTCSEAGNIITIARQVYAIENFSEVAFKLMQEYQIKISEDYIKEVN